MRVERIARRHRKGRNQEQKVRGSRVLPRRNPLSPPGDVRLAAREEIGYVAAEGRRERSQAVVGEIRPPEVPEQPEGLRGVGASTPESRPDGSPLREPDPRPRLDPDLPGERACRAENEVVFAGRDGSPLADELERTGVLDLDLVGEIDRGEPRQDLVEAVGPAPSDPELAVDLRGRLAPEIQKGSRAWSTSCRRLDEARSSRSTLAGQGSVVPE